MKGLGRFLLLVYLMALVVGTFRPFTFVSTAQDLAAKVHRIKWVPFRNPKTGGMHSWRDTAENIVLFLPFGVLGTLALRTDRTRYRTLVPIIVAGLSASLLIETLQLFIVSRVTNVTDVIANTVGCSLGAIVVPWWQRWKDGPDLRLDPRGARGLSEPLHQGRA